MSILLAALSALMYGGADFCGGYATRKHPVYAVLIISQAAGLAVAVAAGFALAHRPPSLSDGAWGAAAGVCGAMGLAALYTALATTPVAVASPVAAVTGAFIPVLLGIAMGERPGTLALVGMVISIPAIALLSSAPAEHGQGGSTRRAAVLGAAAGLGFGLFFFAISRTSRDSGLWPLVASRVTSICLVSVFALATGKQLRAGRGGLPMIVACGCLDMGANIAFLLSSRLGMLSIAAVVTSLYPAPTVLLAMLVFKERLTLPRAAGIALALAGVALISV